MAKPRFNDRFVAGTLIGALPLLVWAAHFFIAYLTVKTACALDLQRFTFDGIPLITILLGLLSAAAIGALLWMVALQGGETRRHFDGGGTLAIVHMAPASSRSPACCGLPCRLCWCHRAPISISSSRAAIGALRQVFASVIAWRHRSCQNLPRTRRSDDG